MTNVITIIVVTSNLLFQNRQLTPATNAQMAVQQVQNAAEYLSRRNDAYFFIQSKQH